MPPRCIVVLVALVLLDVSHASAADLVSPSQDGVLVGTRLPLLLSDCLWLRDVALRIDGRDTTAEFEPDTYAGRWITHVDLPFEGVHRIELQGSCGLCDHFLHEVTVRNDLRDSTVVAELAAAQFIHDNPPESLPWNWGPAVLLYGLLQLAEVSSAGSDYVDYIRAFHAHHAASGLPAIDRADACAPALSALGLATRFGDERYLDQVERVMDYVRSAERNALGTLDHLGHSLESVFYPSSIWVDSLMMWVLATHQYAILNGDKALVRFARAQPALYRNVLRHPASGMSYHAWNVEEEQRLPANNVPWLRGNGWLMTFLVDMLEQLPPASALHASLSAQLRELAAGAVAHRLPSGYWDTLVTSPGSGYEESSGSALVAYALAKGTRLDILPDHYRQLAKDTFVAITARMQRRGEGYSMEQISLGTNPFGPVLYAIWPTGSQISYGVGALTLLATELAGERFP